MVQRGAPPPSRCGVSLIEMLIVLTLMGIIAGIALPTLQPQITDQLTLAGQSVVADLDYLRTLAISNNTSYGITFEPAANRYWIEHRGSAAVWNALPTSAYFASEAGTGGRSRWVVNLPELLPSGVTVELVECRRVGSGAALESFTFEPLGTIDAGEQLVIWLGCGSADQRRYLPVYIETTGMVWAGEIPAASFTP